MPRSLSTALVVLLLLGSACSTRLAPDPSVLARVSGELGQLLLVGFTGTEGNENAQVEELVCGARVGGLLLFGRNIVDDAQVRRLTAAIRGRALGCSAGTPLIGVDAEGGRVKRLRPGAGYTSTPSARELGGTNDLAMTELEARRVGRMLRDAGITWDLAPVVDVGYNPANPVIVGKGRSYGAHPLVVAAHARAFIRGLHAEGVLTALKHFPGHGSSFADSHEGFVDVSDTANREVELLPYRVLVAERIVDAVMTAHVFNRHLDPRYPATLSRPTIQGLLRNDVGWLGAVVSDDLRMGAIEQHYGLGEAAVRSLDAGVDVLLIADDRLRDGRSASAVALAAIRGALADGRLSMLRVGEALSRVATLKRRAASLAQQPLDLPPLR
jgi:beta-N-acetylhexosaminidase